MISREIFVSVIERLRQQYLQDKEYLDGLNSLYGVDNMSLYDNSNLISSCFDLLRIEFPKDSDGHCDIEHFCYVCEFGKIGEVEDAASLYNLLKKKKIELYKKISKEEYENCDCNERLGKKCARCYLYENPPVLHPEVVSPTDKKQIRESGVCANIPPDIIYNPKK